jgi:hypothetical protein
MMIRPTSPPLTAALRHYQAAQGETAPAAPAGPQDVIPVGLEQPSSEKEAVIRDLVRTSPNEAATQRIIEALSAYPLDALQLVAAYGTKIEVYADGSTAPAYMPTLADPNVAGAYNTRANVLGAFESSASPFALLHEFAHALDAALGEPSQGADWKNARITAQYTKNAVRPYATFDECEYMAENTAAFLVADESLVPLIERGLATNVGVQTMTEREYWQMHQNYSHDRLSRLDPQGFALVDDLFKHKVADGLKVEPKPAMTEQTWLETLPAELEKRRAELRKRKEAKEAKGAA